MRPWMWILFSIVLGLVLGLGLTMIELGASPGGHVMADLAYSEGLKSDPSGPRIGVDTERFDFGTMLRDASMEHTFTVRNTGLAPLVLKKGQSSCRCTQFEITNTTLQPGESTPVLIQWHANVNEGAFRQTASIETNDPGRPLVTLAIEGKVRLSHRVNPHELVFSNLSAADSQTADVHIYAYNQKDVQVKSHKFVDQATGDKYEVRFEPMPPADLKDDPEAKGGVLVHVTVKPGLPLGPIRQILNLQLNLPDEPTVEIPLQGNIISDVQIVGRGWDVDRGLIDFGTVPSEEGAKVQLFIQARGPHRRELRPKIIEVDSETLKVSLGQPTDLVDGNLVRVPLTVEIPPGSKRSSHLGNQQSKLAKIMIDTGHPEAKMVRLWVRFAVSE